MTIGNGLIAAFVAGIAMGVAEHEIPDAFVAFSENVSAILQVITFFVFGALIVATGYEGDLWPLLLFVPFALLVARPLAIISPSCAAACPGLRRCSSPGSGPRGWRRCSSPCSSSTPTRGPRSLIFDVAAFTILASILAHGLTDTVGARWVERRMH